MGLRRVRFADFLAFDDLGVGDKTGGLSPDDLSLDGENIGMGRRRGDCDFLAFEDLGVGNEAGGLLCPACRAPDLCLFREAFCAPVL